MRLRALSITLSVASVLLPAVVLIYARRHIAIHYETFGMPVEGKGVAAAFIMLIATSMLLCLSGLALGAVAYLRLQAPKPPMRMLELALQLLPVLLWWLFAMPLFEWVRG